MSDQERQYRVKLAGIADEVLARSGHDIGLLLEKCLLPAMLRGSARLLEDGTDRLASDMEHVADWLAASVAADLKWLRNVDQNGVPKKFSKLMSIEDVKAEADRGMLRMLGGMTRRTLEPGAEVLVDEIEGGYAIVSLRTPEALDRESSEMQHCVGQGGYDKGVRTGSVEILSLRDARGKAHVTMQLSVQDRTLVQIKGKQNRFPATKYFDILVPWIEANGFNVSERELAGGYFLDGSEIRHVGSIAPGEMIDRDLDLHYDVDADIEIMLPPGVQVAGMFRVVNENSGNKARVAFSPGFSATGVSLYGTTVAGLENVSSKTTTAVFCNIEPVPAGSRFTGEVVLDETDIGSLLSMAIFEEGLTINFPPGPSITLPEDADVRKKLNVNSKVPVEISNGFRTLGDLSIEGKEVEVAVHIGEDVQVCGNLSVRNCDLDMADGLSVVGAMAIQYAEVKGLPSMMEVGSLTMAHVQGVSIIPPTIVLNGDLHLTSTDVSSLGGRKEWPGDLRLSKSKVTELPDGLTVGGSLDVSYMALAAFPRGMFVGGSLTAVDCGTGVIHEETVIGGSLNVSNNPYVSLPDNMTINGSLNIENSYFKRMPTGITVGDIIHLGRFPVDRITRWFSAKSYALSGSFVMDLSDLGEIEGHLWIDAKDVSKLPHDTRIGGRLIVRGHHFEARLPSGLEVGEYVRGDHMEILRKILPETAKVGGMRAG